MQGGGVDFRMQATQIEEFTSNENAACDLLIAFGAGIPFARNVVNRRLIAVGVDIGFLIERRFDSGSRRFKTAKRIPAFGNSLKEKRTERLSFAYRSHPIGTAADDYPTRPGDLFQKCARIAKIHNHDDLSRKDRIQIGQVSFDAFFFIQIIKPAPNLGCLQLLLITQVKHALPAMTRQKDQQRYFLFHISV